MRTEAEAKDDKEIAPEMALLDLGDAMQVTKQVFPYPRFADSAVGGWGIHPA